jgi:IS5 family transposase
MLRMYCMANWFNLGDEACEEALYDTAVFREFCRIDLGEGRVPDATTLLHFRHLMEKHELGAALFAKVGELLQANGLRFSGGTIIDATLIEMPSSTKNREKARDPEMHSTKKGNQWHFGMKVHIGADSRTGIVHHASITAAHVHDSHEVPNLLFGNETRFYGDSAYRGRAQRERLKTLAPRAKDFTHRRAYWNRPLSEVDKAARPPRFRHAGTPQSRQMGKASHGRGASNVAGNRGKSPRIRLPKAIFPTRKNPIVYLCGILSPRPSSKSASFGCLFSASQNSSGCRG